MSILEWAESVTANDLSHIEAELKGKTLLVYWRFLRRGSEGIGTRAIQRDLNLSSPSVAFHHLEKLRRLGLLYKNQVGEYRLVGDLKIGLLRFFVRWGRIMLPRYFFYSIMFTCMLVTYLVVYPQSLLNIHNLVAFIFSVVSYTIFWYETIKIRKEAPF
ncbi:MAG: hypothetical protein NWF13_03710 [Candidatus Bathyarchaeota archaeon]|nr:hypothetical protein [Candidatus Bathyarchaeota archaeon]